MSPRLAACAAVVALVAGAAASLASSPAASRGLGEEAARFVPFVHVVGGRAALEGLDPHLKAGYGPHQIQRAYDMGPLYRGGLEGSGARIGIVDAFGSPTIESDLATFDRIYNIAAPPSFTVQQPAGPVPKFNADNSDMVGWAVETTLDVEWAHAMAPKARIFLAETPAAEVAGASGLSQIVSAEEYLISHDHVGVITQSFGVTEQAFPSKLALQSLRGAFFEAAQHHVTVLAAAGDAGASGLRYNGKSYYGHRVTSWPATDPLVTAVGGTAIDLARSGGQLRPAQVWNERGATPRAAGGGVSSVFRRPKWQEGVARVVGSRRGIPDLSLTASCSHPADIFASFDGAFRTLPICGTSLAAPLFAGIVAIADELAGHPLGLLNPTLYSLGRKAAPGLVGVTRGDNTVEIPGSHDRVVVGYRAISGFNLASGWGTVRGAPLVSELARKSIRR